MNCDEARIRLSMEMDGELDEAAARELVAHVSGCAACLEYRERLGGADAKLGQIARAMLPPPAFSFRLPGMPCTASSLTLMSVSAGKPYTIRGAERAPKERSTSPPTSFSSAVVTPGFTAFSIRASVIRTIRPINTQVVKEVKSDMGEIEATERDPSIPDEPPEAE